jgi:SAM-dependent methyltransferase
MSVFGAYSRYYNLLYQDKDYRGETDYICGLIQKYQPGATSILDLGCGTGRHDMLLSGKGYSVTGIDMSEEMLSVARSQTGSGNCLNPEFLQGDIRTFRMDRSFDVVVSLFHVMSYQVTNADLKSAFATARTHLKPGGIFIFDCWYGPAVLTDRPTVRVKRLEDEGISITRIAEPVIYPNQNLVDVNYHVFLKEKSSGSFDEIKETHSMRYLFKPEIEFFSGAVQMEIIESTEWMTGKVPGFDTWGVCFVVRG